MIHGVEAEDGGGCVVCQEVTATTLAMYNSNKKDYVCRIEA